MFLYRVKVEELTAQSLALLRTDLCRSEQGLRAQCPIREMNVVSDDHAAGQHLDIYLALEDFIDSAQLRDLFGKLRRVIAMGAHAAEASEPRVSTELIHI
jgi:hypothetical protein